MPSPPPAPLPETDALADFTPRPFEAGGLVHTVHVAGSGPAVLVLPEMPGIGPALVRFARWVRDAGFRVHLPSLFGRDGVDPPADEAVQTFRRACIAAEFRALAGGVQSPVLDWLRALARHAHEEAGGPGVGVVGMCFTGNFALGLAMAAPTLAPVACQPTMPLEWPDAPGLAPDELARLRARLEADDLQVLALRFAGDRWCRAARFDALRSALGPRFVAHTLPDTAAHPSPPPFFREVVRSPHSVVTAHLVDAAGEPTLQARDAILAFLARRLKA